VKKNKEATPLSPSIQADPALDAVVGFRRGRSSRCFFYLARPRKVLSPAQFCRVGLGRPVGLEATDVPMNQRIGIVRFVEQHYVREEFFCHFHNKNLHVDQYVITFLLQR
jgi:hypothetical protein